MSKPLLTMRGVTGGYGEADILHDVSMDVGAGEVVVIVGPNGAGKSTAMKSVFGLLHVQGRQDSNFDGHRPDRACAPTRLFSRGVSYVPQNGQRLPEPFRPGKPGNGRLSAERTTFSDVVGTRLRIVPAACGRKRRQAAGTLSGGQRQMVAMGRALMLDPKLLLLDEPTAGLSPLYMDQIFAIVRADQRPGRRHPDGRAECQTGARHRGPGPMCWSTAENRHDGTGHDLLHDPEVAEMFLGGGKAGRQCGFRAGRSSAPDVRVSSISISSRASSSAAFMRWARSG